MKKILTGTLLACALSGSLLAGGKTGIAPVIVPIIPIFPSDDVDQADPNPWYVGIGFVTGKFTGECTRGCPYEDVTYGILLRAGYEWNQYIGVEARALNTFWGEDPLGGEKLSHIGLFAKPSYPLGEDFNVYGLFGYGWTKTKSHSPYLPQIKEYGFSYGFGLEYDLSSKEDDYDNNTHYDRPFDGQADQEKGWGLFIDYQRLLVKSGVPDMDAISIGITYDF